MSRPGRALAGRVLNRISKGAWPRRSGGAPGRALRAPATHFAVAGALLFLLVDVVSPVRSWRDGAGGVVPGRSEVRIPAAALVTAERDWMRRTGRAPSPTVRRALLRDLVDEELLYREALALGFGRTDTVVRERLVRNADFLGLRPDAAGPSAGIDPVPHTELERAAVALGFERTDIVVRRRLVQRLRLLIEDRVRAREPGRSVLAKHLARHAARFQLPPRVDLTHVFVSRRIRGAGLAVRAQAVGDALAAWAGTPADAAARFGDPSPLPATVSGRSRHDLARVFGDRLATAVLEGRPGRWAGPLPSPYGLHFVWIRARHPARVPPLDAVRAAVREELLAEQTRAAMARLLRRLRRKARVRIVGALPAPAATSAPSPSSGAPAASCVPAREPVRAG